MEKPPNRVTGGQLDGPATCSIAALHIEPPVASVSCSFACLVDSPDQVWGSYIFTPKVGAMSRHEQAMVTVPCLQVLPTSNIVSMVLPPTDPKYILA